MYFKNDASFLDKIALGAMGTQHVFSHLQRGGHRIIELERGSLSSKIWSDIKVKRVRVPDLMCVLCGTKIEVRAKSSLEISMSHSEDASRRWDYGLENGDYVALVPGIRDPGASLGWSPAGPIYYVKVGDLRVAAASGKAYATKPKGAGEGFESRIIWPVRTSTTAGTVVTIDDASLHISPPVGRRRRLKLTTSKDNRVIRLQPVVAVGDSVKEGAIVASSVPVSSSVPCANHIPIEHYYEIAISQEPLPSRYAAIKAIGYYPMPEPKKDHLAHALAVVATRESEPLLALEAAATAIRLGYHLGYGILNTFLRADSNELRLEAVIVLSELPGKESVTLLSNTLVNKLLHPEIRAGAAWALGKQEDVGALGVLTRALCDPEQSVREWAARSIAIIARRHLDSVVEAFFSNSDRLALQGLAWAVARAKGGGALARALLENPGLGDRTHAPWAALALSHLNPNNNATLLKALRSAHPDIYSGLCALREYFGGWIGDLERPT